VPLFLKRQYDRTPGGVLFFASHCSFESTVAVQAGMGFRGGDTGSDEFSTAPQVTISGPSDGPAFLLAHVENIHISNLAILAQTTGVVITDSALVRLTNVAINAQVGANVRPAPGSRC
jgi:hypothetical protein